MFRKKPPLEVAVSGRGDRPGTYFMEVLSCVAPRALRRLEVTYNVSLNPEDFDKMKAEDKTLKLFAYCNYEKMGAADQEFARKTRVMTTLKFNDLETSIKKKFKVLMRVFCLPVIARYHNSIHVFPLIDEESIDDITKSKILARLIDILNSFKILPVKVDHGITLLKFTEAMKKGDTIVVDHAKENISDYNRSIDRNLTEVSNYFDKIKVERLKIKSVDIDNKKYALIYKNVMRIKGVKEIGFEGNNMYVITDYLSAKVINSSSRYDKKTVSVGAFKITFKDARVWLENLCLKRHKDGGRFYYDHPNAKEGKPCWGNMKSILTMVSESKYDAAIQMIISFLETINDGDPWCSYQDFKKMLKTEAQARKEGT